MLQKINLTNFKCFESLRLTCAPLTLLCGLNGMGKSSVLQALLVLRQSFASGELLQGRLILNGELSELGTGQDVLYEGAGDEVVEFELDLDASPYVDESPVPWRLSFGYSRTDDELRIMEVDRFAGSRPIVSRPWNDVPPLGGHLIYVNTSVPTIIRIE